MIRKDPSFTFLTIEDKKLYQQQLDNGTGHTTNDDFTFSPHPSKIRKNNQSSSKQFSFPTNYDCLTDESSDSDVYEQDLESPEKQKYN